MPLSAWIEVHANDDISRIPFGCDDGAALFFQVRYIVGVFSRLGITYLVLSEKMHLQPVRETVYEVLTMIASAQAGE